MNRPDVTLAVFAMLSVAVSAGCSSHAETAPAATPGVSGPGTGTPAATGHIGDTLTLTRADDSPIAVTLQEVINPATPTPSPGDPGVTYIATKLMVAAPGTAAIEGNVNINVSMVASDGQSLAPDLRNVSECANFDSGVFNLQPGQSATGCVVFALPPNVSPAKLKYLPSSGFAEDFGEWNLP
ncbi:DUF4352 domain-containing protein [Mycolicibacter sp. MYC123]|uniref:DUF4352 domain-containing protein n=1 Tax=[Mycobacterium] zoologicum TaxID=2872311 RepID=A0ABU5YMK0_9MYCO|nr:DUF4352 domain-containing protein [Mycolicibacter sp. MYC123]MEB3051292.1 DUF4352 domain-containing protein [Mycolicibacter sp. MYC123]